MIVEHITYDTIEGSYDSSIFTAEKHGLTMDKAYPAKKAIQDYVYNLRQYNQGLLDYR